ncbi:hypothetical protein L9F63_012587 [Diploptera punctata]|uniref:Inosine/uridine-preferring nucleoside hydrolase domain-containing protein n=1 Tax=Diploptera punctata TaxID=6984 RepID=A0AAD8AC56_DIPPU|nr:hypothetical protein L9F63_012587 [Diploptera punctata]
MYQYFRLSTSEGSLESPEMDLRLPKLETGKLIIDTDAGVDDAVAIFLALGYEAKQRNTNLQVIAITCVFGNTNVDNVVANVLKVLKTANRLDIPVYKGASRPLLVTPSTNDYFGKDGLGDFVYPDPPNPTEYVRKEHAALALIQLVSQYPKQITLLCLGPLTNVALAIRLDPSFISKLKQIIILGGSTEGVGNTKPGIEFNFYVDPEANFIVFDSVNASVNPIVLFPWESVVKRNVIPMQWRTDVLGKISSPQICFLNLAERKQLQDEANKCWQSGDALIAGVTVNPSLVTQASPRYHAMPETQGTRSRGALFIDYSHVLENAPLNVVIIESIDVSRYKMMLKGYLT